MYHWKSNGDGGVPGEVSVWNEIYVVIVLMRWACFKFFFLPYLISGACARMYFCFLHLILADMHQKGIYAGGSVARLRPG